MKRRGVEGKYDFGQDFREIRLEKGFRRQAVKEKASKMASKRAEMAALSVWAGSFGITLKIGAGGRFKLVRRV